MYRAARLLLFLFFVLFSGGCIEVDQEFFINPDSSGKFLCRLTVAAPDNIDSEAQHYGIPALELMAQRVRSELHRYRGVEKWKDTSYRFSKNRKLFFYNATAYFKKLSDCFFPVAQLNISPRYNFYRNADGQIEIALTTLGPDRLTVLSGLSARKRAETMVQTRIWYARARLGMPDYYKSIRLHQILHLPANIRQMSNFSRISASSAEIFARGGQILAAMDSAINDDFWLSDRVQYQDNVFAAGWDYSLNKKVFGKKGPVNLLLYPAVRNLFDYESEISAASAAEPGKTESGTPDANSSRGQIKSGTPDANSSRGQIESGTPDVNSSRGQIESGIVDVNSVRGQSEKYYQLPVGIADFSHPVNAQLRKAVKTAIDGNFEDAIQLYMNIIANKNVSDKYLAWTHYQLGMCLFNHGFTQQAVEEFDYVVNNFAFYTVTAFKAARQLNLIRTGRAVPEYLTLAHKLKEKAPPAVISTQPTQFSDEVPVDTARIVLHFDKPMRKFLWCYSSFDRCEFPRSAGPVQFDDSLRVWTLPVKLEPGRVYAVTINNPSAMDARNQQNNTGFVDADGIAARPFVLVFSTVDKTGLPVPIDDKILRKAKAFNRELEKE